MTDDSPDRLRWAVLGTGQIARKFAADLSASRTGRLTVVASRSAESSQAFLENLLAGQPDHRRSPPAAVAGYEAALAREDVDAVYIALPNILHREWTLAALAAGKHVLCEKPLALSADEAREMFAASRKADRLLMEAFMYRAHPQTQLLREVLDSGRLGEIRLARANFTFSRPVLPGDARYRPDAGGGSLMDVGCYCIDFLRLVTGEEPSEVHAVRHRHESGTDDYAAGTLTFPGGALATFTCGMTVASDPTSHIAGTAGRIEIPRFWFGREGFRFLEPVPGQPGEWTGVTHRIEEDLPPLYAIEADSFHDVLHGSPNWNAPENTIANLEILDRIRE